MATMVCLLPARARGVNDRGAVVFVEPVIITTMGCMCGRVQQRMNDANGFFKAAEF